LFKEIGVSEHTAVTLARVRRVTHEEARFNCGIRYKSDHLEGLAFPYLDPKNEDRVVHWRVRRDNPEVESNGKPVAKYLSSPDRKRLYFAPGSYSKLTDASAPAIIVESEKAVLAMMDAEVRCNRRHALLIATGGCWGWRGVIGKATSPNGARVDEKGALVCFDKVTWTGRDTIICFDANVATNEKVQTARRALTVELEKRGAKMRVVDLPIETDINGPDDFIGKHGAAAFWTLIDKGKPATAKTSKAKPEKARQGREVQFDEPEPWPDPVDGGALLTAIASTFPRYLALPKHANIALALWVLHAYTFSAWFTSPFLAITSPAKRCGKTLLLIVLGALVPRRLFASNVTPAVLFRTIEKYSPVLLIDEADTFVRDNDELRGVLNSGHTRTTAVAIRAVGDDHEPRAFSTWCAKAIALIGKLPGTLADRAIEIPMRRRTAGESVERLRQDRIEGLCQDTRRQAARWADDHLAHLQDRDPSVPDTLNDRAADCWRPLLAIADHVGGPWPTRAREAALALAGAADDEDVATLLLGDLRDIFEAEDNPDVLASSVLIEQLVALEDRPWAEWSKGRPMSPAKLARMLAGYSVHPAGSIRVGAKTARAYRRTAFVEAWDRYLADFKALQRDNPNETGPEPAISKRDTDAGCDGLLSVTNPIDTERSHTVTHAPSWCPPGLGGRDGQF